MFDITSSKLFLLAIVALLVIGPKDFPVLLRTIGKYVGILRGHAREFRAQFDEVMRESEMAEIKKDMENLARETEGVARETEASMNATGQSMQQTFDEARQGVEASVKMPATPAAGQQAVATEASPEVPPADGAETAQTETAQTGTDQTDTAPAQAPVAPAEPAVDTPPEPAPSPSEPAPAVERTGV